MLISSVYNVGKSWHEKVKEVRGTLTKKKADALVITALDEVACKESSIHFKCLLSPTGVLHLHEQTVEQNGGFAIHYL